MADVKISGLPASTTPLAGTEVLPIVQGNVTKKVASNDLTVKNIRSNATTGILQVAGPGTDTTRVMTTPDANFSAARTDAAQSFTGNQTLTNGTFTVPTTYATTTFIPINTSTPTTIVSGVSFLAILRCRGNGGTAMVLYENNVTPVIVSQAGPVLFTLAAPIGNQIQIANGGSSITALAGSGVGANSLNVSVLQNQ